MLQVNFNKPFDHVMVKQSSKEIRSITIKRMVDNPIRKIVAVETKEMGRVVLWEGADYDAIGQWTDSDVATRLHQLFGH